MTQPSPRLAPLAIAALLSAACGLPLRDTSADACPAEPPALDGGAGAHALKTVFVVVLENRSWSQIEGSPSAPYINGTLLPAFAHATNHRNGGLHPSLPSYVLLEAGDPLGIRHNVTPTRISLPVTCHLTSWLEATGLSWKSYQEGISGEACPLHDDGRYAVRHDPFVYFADVTGDPPRADAPRCLAHVRPYSELAADLAAGTVARYNFITPDLCHSGHDRCAPANDRVRQQDDWLASELPRIMASPAWQDGGVILVTWDEESGDGDAPIGLIAVSPLARPGYASAAATSHASTLRTVQEILGVTPLLRQAATATPLSDLFTAYP